MNDDLNADFKLDFFRITRSKDPLICVVGEVLAHLPPFLLDHLSGWPDS